MQQLQFEKKYEQQILPKYGDQRNIRKDDQFLETNHYPHQFSISDRLDLTHLEVYSVDPDNCSDADDAFSIHENDNQIYLVIHIADPTYYINLDSPLWKNILKNNITKYPSNHPPIHLMPQKIMELSSLSENSEGNIKNAISLFIEIDNKTFQPKDNIKIHFSKIKVKKENGLTYKNASQLYKTNRVFQIGQKINQNLQKKRAANTVGVKLNELSYAYVTYDKNGAHLCQDSPDEKNLKQMIAEFAILANSYIGKYLKTFLDGKAIFRTCNAKEWLHKINCKDIKGTELINKIINEGISADYFENVNSHDLVGSEQYTHFTSPIRRVSDCISHYLLKFIHLQSQNLKLENPFTTNFLKEISARCNFETKKFKKIQYTDTKFRLIQAMSNIINRESSIIIKYRIITYSGLFINILISQINEYHIHMSYTLRYKTKKYINYPQDYQTLEITKVYPPNKFDEGTIPELDSQIYQIFTS